MSYSKSTLDNGVTPVLYADTGFPTLPAVPRIDPTISNGLSTAWWKTSPSRLPETYDFSLSIQRRLTGSIVLETSYNGTMGVHLASNLYDPNQLPYSYIAEVRPCSAEQRHRLGGGKSGRDSRGLSPTSTVIMAAARPESPWLSVCAPIRCIAHRCWSIKRRAGGTLHLSLLEYADQQAILGRPQPAGLVRVVQADWQCRCKSGEPSH